MKEWMCDTTVITQNINWIITCVDTAHQWSVRLDTYPMIAPVQSHISEFYTLSPPRSLLQIFISLLYAKSFLVNEGYKKWQMQHSIPNSILQQQTFLLHLLNLS